MNVHNFKRVMKAIAAAPEWQTEMSKWHCAKPCGTAHCIAGWCEVLTGVELTDPDSAMTKSIAKRWLGISWEQGQQLFFTHNWPQPFRAQYQDSPKQTTLARLAHFIKTEGRE